MSVVYDNCVFFPIDWNNFCYKTFDHCTLFCLKTSLSTFTQNLKVIETPVFFSPIYFVGAPVFCPNTEYYLGLRGWCPWNYLVWIGLMSYHLLTYTINSDFYCFVLFIKLVQDYYHTHYCHTCLTSFLLYTFELKGPHRAAQITTFVYFCSPLSVPAKCKVYLRGGSA